MGCVMTQDEAIVHTAEAKRNGRRVAFTYGCFDLLHPGHIRRLEHTRTLADTLIVGINSDAAMRAQEGESRPPVPQEERAEILCALQAVDAVVVFEWHTLRDLIARLSPDVLVPGGDEGSGEFIGAESVEGAGGRVVLIPTVPGYSISAILRRIREPDGKDEALSSPGGHNKK